jgi:hypothetical protein
MSEESCALEMAANTVAHMARHLRNALIVLLVALAMVRALSDNPDRALAGSRDTYRLESLIIAPESGSGTYRRSYFNHWVDEDHDCLNTRAEVLLRESLKETRGECRIRSGRWWSWYDYVYIEDASKLDIDHLVALKEAWESGASRWSPQRRESFANDLTSTETLTAVSATQNRRKSDKDPAQWLPPHGTCRYVASWVAVKLRWGLSVDKDEYNSIAKVLAGCL